MIYIKPLNNLLFTQFLSAFADNAIFFTILSYLAKNGSPNPEAKMASIQAAFLLAYIILAPIVGALADKNAKSRILVVGNILKGLGVIALFLGISPLISYGVIGVGAVVYSPAKYGILTELTNNEDELLKANAKIESFTIVAILLGTVAGGAISDLSISLGMLTCFAFYILSCVMSIFIPKVEGNPEISYSTSVVGFFKDLKLLFKTPKTNFALIGASAFWMTSAVLRIAFLGWLATYLNITSQASQSAIVGTTAVGIVFGALLTPKLIKPHEFYKVYLYGIALVAVIFASYFVHNLPLTIVLLLTIGFLGGVFVVPLNATLQDEGKKLIGSGKTIAIQNFSENILMLLGMLLYKFATANNIPINLTILGVGTLLLIFVLSLAFQVSKLKVAN